MTKVEIVLSGITFVVEVDENVIAFTSDEGRPVYLSSSESELLAHLLIAAGEELRRLLRGEA